MKRPPTHLEPVAALADRKPPDAEPWRDLRIASEPGPIRLNKKQALPLDAMKNARKIQIAEPSFTRKFDWNVIIAACGMAPLEAKAFLLVWRYGVPAYHLHHALEITFVDASKLYTAVRAKLGLHSQTIGGSLTLEPIHNSLRLAYRDKLPSGARPWALGELDAEFRRIMDAERAPILSIYQTDRICALPVGAQIMRTVNPLAELHHDLQTAGVNCLRLGETTHTRRLAMENSERELRVEQESIKAARAQALLEEKPFSEAEGQKRLAILQTAAAARRAEHEAAVTALQLATTRVETLKSEISARAREAFLIATLPSREMVRTKILDAAQALQAYWEAASGHAEHGNEWIEALFPRDGPDPWTGSSELRGSLIAAAMAVGRIVRDLNSLEQAKAAWKKSA